MPVTRKQIEEKPIKKIIKKEPNKQKPKDEIVKFDALGEALPDGRYVLDPLTNKFTKDPIIELTRRIDELEKKLIMMITPTAPNYILSLLSSLLEGELKRCKNGKWPAKEQNVRAVALYFGIELP